MFKLKLFLQVICFIALIGGTSATPSSLQPNKDSNDYQKQKSFYDDLLGQETRILKRLSMDEIAFNMDQWRDSITFSSLFSAQLQEANFLNENNCYLEHLSSRLRQLNRYDPIRYESLHPYLRFFARLQVNLCLQYLEEKRSNLIDDALDKFHWLAWYDITESDIGTPISSSSSSTSLSNFNSSPNGDEIRQKKKNAISIFGGKLKSCINCAKLTLSPPTSPTGGQRYSSSGSDNYLSVDHISANKEQKQLEQVAFKMARHLKRYIPKIERKYFSSREEHESVIESEVNLILNDICTIITDKDLLQDQPVGYSILLEDLRTQLNGDFKDDIWTRYESLCAYDTNRESFIELVQVLFHSKFDMIDTEDIDKTLDDVKDALFNEDNALTTRSQNPFELIEQLQQATSPRSSPEIKSDIKLIKSLYELRMIKANKYYCSKNALEDRFNLEGRFSIEGEYPSLRSYVKSLNVLQFNRCLQLIRNIASKMSTSILPYQLTLLEELYESIVGVQRQIGFQTPPNHEIYNLNLDSFFAKGAAKFLFDRLEKNNVGVFEFNDRYNELMAKTCLNVVNFLDEALAIYETLFNLDLLSKSLGQTTIHLLNYGNICQYHLTNIEEFKTIEEEFNRILDSIEVMKASSDKDRLIN